VACEVLEFRIVVQAIKIRIFCCGAAWLPNSMAWVYSQKWFRQSFDTASVRHDAILRLQKRRTGARGYAEIGKPV